MAKDTETCVFSTRIPKWLSRAVKVRACEEEITMSQFVEQAVRAKLKAEEKT